MRATTSVQVMVLKEEQGMSGLDQPLDRRPGTEPGSGTSRTVTPASPKTPQPEAKPPPNRHLVRDGLIAGAVIVVLAAGGWAAWRIHLADQSTPGIVSSNGRIEATEVDIATKVAGRVIEVVPQEGDMIAAGAVAARLDPVETAAALGQALAQANQARDALKSARDDVASNESDLTFAGQELGRTSALVKDGWATREAFDHRRQQETTAKAALAAAVDSVSRASAAIVAAEAHVAQLKGDLADDTIVSPVLARVEYRLVEPGAVLAAGGRILTLLDLSDVYMTIFLSADDAGKLAIGDEARVVLDAAPGDVFPATISFVAAQAQFTPKTVETSIEREKLLFRVRLRAPPETLRTIGSRVKTGLRGLGYVRTDRNASWPARLVVKLPE